MHELLKASLLIPPLSPHVFHSCSFGFVVIKADTPFMWTHDKWLRTLTPSLQFFLTVVSFFGGKLMTQLNFPLWLFLWGFLLLWCSEARVRARWALRLKIYPIEPWAHTLGLTSFLERKPVIDKQNARTTAKLQWKKWEWIVIHFCRMFPPFLFFILSQL